MKSTCRAMFLFALLMVACTSGTRVSGTNPADAPDASASAAEARVARDPGTGFSDELRGRTAIRTHLHVHALSNHNGGEFPSSVGFQMDEADRLPGRDFVWWTEHEEIFIQHNCAPAKTFTFADLVWKDSTSLVLSEETSKKTFMGWNVARTGGVSIALEAGRLRAHLPRRGRLEVHPFGRDGLIRSMNFAVPLMLEPAIRIVAETTAPLSIESRHRLSFDSSPDAHAAPPTSPAYEVRVDEWEGGALVLAATAEQTADYDDHSWHDWSLVFEAGDDSATITLDTVVAGPSHCDGDRAWGCYQTLMAKQRGAHTDRSAIGAEYRMLDREWHLCVMMPGDIEPAFLQMDQKNQFELWRAEATRLGGLVSLCHVLGTVPRTEPPSPSIRKAMRDRAFTTLTQSPVPCYGSDLFEIGYRMRGNGVLDDYLLMWDAFASAGIPMVGIGVSDVHGEFWGVEMAPGGWATWIYGDEDPVSLLAALRNGEAYCAEIGGWDRDLWLEADGAGMGGRTRRGVRRAPGVAPSVSGFDASAPDMIPRRIRLRVADSTRVARPHSEEAPEYFGATMELVAFRLGQKIASPDDFVYLETGRVIEPNQWFDLSLPDSTAIRAVVRARSGGVVAATNAIHLGVDN